MARSSLSHGTVISVSSGFTIHCEPQFELVPERIIQGSAMPKAPWVPQTVILYYFFNRCARVIFMSSPIEFLAFTRAVHGVLASCARFQRVYFLPFLPRSHALSIPTICSVHTHIPFNLTRLRNFCSEYFVTAGQIIQSTMITSH